MPSDPKTPSSSDPPQAAGVPPLLPSAEPPLIAVPPLASRKSSPLRYLIALLLNLCLGLFLADAVISLADESLILFFGIHLLAGVRAIIFLFAILMAILIYALMGLTPWIPKRWFLPVTLFNPVALLVAVPLCIYFYHQIPQMAWAISFSQVVCGLAILYRVEGGFKFRWPLVAESQLEGRGFSWRNLVVFLLTNVFGLLPATVVYLALCAAVAVNHFSEGFVALRPGGLTMQVRKYVRADGKTIQLIPMSHVGEPAFYRALSRSFPTNSIILMEGVTDNQNLLTNKISYKRMATSLGLSEQVKEFRPTRGEMVSADVDVEQFAPSTIGLLNLAMLFHTRGVNAGNVLMLMQYSPPPHFEDQLFEDLLRKRNRRLLEELQARLPQTENIIVPWGAAHIPEIAKEIQKSGFRLDETREYVVIRFGRKVNPPERTQPLKTLD